MSEETFLIANSLDGKGRRPHPYVDSFEAHGHVWVVHRKIYGIGFKVSHRGSGYAVPSPEGVDPESAKAKAMAFLDANALSIPKAIDEVTR